MRALFAVFWWLATLAALAWFGAWVKNMDGIVAGAALWLIVTGLTARWFLLSVPEVTGLVTVNLFTGSLRPYGTGLHFRFPWEQVKEGNYINLRIITQEFGKDGKGVETYPSADGPEMLVQWSFQYRATIPGLPRYIAVDETTINNGLREIGSSFLSGTIGRLEAEKIREADRNKLEEELRKHYETKTHQDFFGGEVKKGSLEELYGIDLLIVSLSDIDFSKPYQQARETRRITGVYKKAAEELRLITVKNGDGTETEVTDEGMSHSDAFNNVMTVQGKATKSISVVEGAGAQAGLAALQSIFGGNKR